MVQICVVSGCEKESYPDCGISFHRLPAKKDLKNIWKEVLQLQHSVKLSEYSVVCSLHFKKEDYLTEAKNKLKSDAIPSILPKVRNQMANVFYGKPQAIVQDLHNTTIMRFPQAIALKLPTNVVDINASEMGPFSPLRERDISGPVINSYYQKQNVLPKIDITVQADPHMNKYDCRGAVSLSSSMQSNVPSPFAGNHTHLGMPGSQWGQGQKYLSDHLHSAHYLTLRNEYRGRMHKAVGTRLMSSDTEANPKLSAKEKLKKAVKEYGSTVIVFHVGISLVSLGSCYLLMSSGVDLVALLKYFNIGEGVITKAAGSNAGTFVIAYAVHKCFAPVRIFITLTATPFIVRYLRNIGFLKSSINAGGGK